MICVHGSLESKLRFVCQQDNYSFTIPFMVSVTLFSSYSLYTTLTHTSVSSVLYEVFMHCHIIKTTDKLWYFVDISQICVCIHIL